MVIQYSLNTNRSVGVNQLMNYVADSAEVRGGVTTSDSDLGFKLAIVILLCFKDKTRIFSPPRLPNGYNKPYGQT